MSTKFKQHADSVTFDRELFKEKVVLNDNLTKKDFRVLMKLMTYLDGLEFKKVSKSNIANELNMSKKDVSNAIDSLIDEDIIIYGSSSSVNNGYKFII